MPVLAELYKMLDAAVAALADGKLDTAESAELLGATANLINEFSVHLDDQAVGQVMRSTGLVIQRFADVTVGGPSAGPGLLEAFCHLGFASVRLWQARLEK